ncbi:MAG: glutamate--tRNA ligase family protein, partial [Verrucomicrobiia bacterium]
GTFVLRIEDTDVARSTPESLRTILDGLRWLGLDWDEGPEKGGPLGPYFQSQRADIYKRRVRELIDKGMAYEREGAVRFKMTREPIEIPDLIVGDVVRPLNETEMLDPDFVIVRSDGNPVFHLVNVVDDIEMQITHVMRGEDHLSNTPKHIALFRAFGVEPPKYAHIPMILNLDGTKMSKSDPDVAKARLASLQTYVDDGYVSEAVRNYLCLLGWSPKDNREVMPIDEVIKLFDLPQILRTNARFDVTKLTWMNGEYIRAMPRDRFIKLAGPFIGGHDDANVLGLVQEKVKLLKELPDRVSYFFSDDYPFDPEAVKKSCSTPQTSEWLTKLTDKFAGVAKWDTASIEAALKALATELGVKTGELIHPCRVAISGKSAGPSLYHMLEVLGRDRVLSRLRKAAERFRA